MKLTILSVAFFIFSSVSYAVTTSDLPQHFDVKLSNFDGVENTITLTKIKSPFGAIINISCNTDIERGSDKLYGQTLNNLFFGGYSSGDLFYRQSLLQQRA